MRQLLKYRFNATSPQRRVPSLLRSPCGVHCGASEARETDGDVSSRDALVKGNSATHHVILAPVFITAAIVTTIQVIIDVAVAVAPAATNAAVTLRGVTVVIISGVVALSFPNVGGRRTVKSITNVSVTASVIIRVVTSVPAVVPMNKRIAAATSTPGICITIARITNKLITSAVTTKCTDAIVIPAIFISPVSPFTPVLQGWPAWPVTLSASFGGVLVDVEVDDGRVVMLLAPTSGVGNGSGDDGKATAATTTPTNAIATLIRLTTTTPIVPRPSLLRDTGSLPIVHAGIAPALLPVLMIVMVDSRSVSEGGRGRSSEGPRRDRRYPVHSLPPPTVVKVRAARHGGDRPSVFVNTSLTTMPPRPGPASLLSSSMRSQLARIRQRGGRVGGSPRAAVTASAGGCWAGRGRRRASGRDAAAVAR